MRILHVLATPRAEGTPNLVLDWLSIAGHEQEVFALNRTPADLTDELQARAAWYGESDLFRDRGPAKFLRVVGTIRRVCHERRPDLVICWSTGFAPWISAAVRGALGGNAAVLVHSGNPRERSVRSDCMSLFILLPVWLFGGKVVCCSDYVRDLHRAGPGMPAALFATVYNCIRGQEIRARAAAVRADRAPVGLMVATLEAHKDHATLLRALPMVLAERPDFRLRLAGDGSLRAELEAMAAGLGVAAAVEFLGSRRDVPELLGQAALFILATTSQEGLGSVLLEALAAGVPVVASDHPACREALADGRYGLLVAPADPRALASGILRVLEAKIDWRAEEGIDYACGFTPERMQREYLQLAR